MSLDTPRAFFGHPISHSSSSNPRWTKAAAYGGVNKLPRQLTATAPKEKATTALDVIWPSKLPGFLLVVFYEDNEDRHHHRLQTLSTGDDTKRDYKEKEEHTPLCIARLWRAPGQKAEADEWVQLTRPVDETYFLGVHLNLEVKVHDGDDQHARVEQTLYLENLPILSADDPGDAAEGRFWELGVYTCFVPLAKQSLYDDFRDQSKANLDHGAPLTDLLSKLLLAGGRFGPPAYANLQRNVNLYFHDRIKDDAGAEEVVPIADRWMAVMHWAWLTGKQDHYYTRFFLVKFPANPEVITPKAYDCDYELVGTKALKGALPPLSRLPVPGKGKLWIKDVVLKNPKDGEHQRHFIGTYGFQSAYWRLPDGFDPSKEPVSLREVEKLAPGIRWTPGDATKLIFNVTSPRERFQLVLKELLERLTLVNAYKEFFRRHYEENKDELDTWGNVVAPIYDAFGKVNFTVNKILGYVDAGTFHEWSGASRKFNDRAIDEAVRKEGRLDLRRTLGKVGTLAFYEQQARQHMEKAWTLYCSPEFQKPFLSGEFIGKKLEVHLGAAQDGTIVAVPQISGDERKQLKKALQEHESTYHYGMELILYIMHNLALNFPLLSSLPQPKDTGAAAADAANKQAYAARKQRESQFQANLGARYQELLEAEAKGQFSEELKTSVKWVGAPGKLTIWDSMTGGGLALMLYGNEAQRDLLSKQVLGLKDGKAFWRLSSKEWDDIATEVRARAGREMKHLDNDGLSVVLGILGQTVAVAELCRKGVKFEVGSVLELIDVVVGTMDNLLKLGQLMKPVFFRVAWKVAGEVTEIAIKGAGAVQAFAKGLGKVAAIVAVVKAGYDIFTMVVDWSDGFDMDWGKLVFKALELVAAVLFFFLPVVGAILGALILVGEMIYSWFTETAMEGMMVWWFSTPWGLPLGDADHDDAPIPVSKPGKLLELAAEKLNPFLEEVSKKLADKPEFKDVKAYLGSYFETNAERYGYRLIDKSTPKVIKFALQKA